MSSALNTKPCELTNDAVDLAEALGIVLGAKLHDTVKEAISSEAQFWRTDALRILTELRDDIKTQFENSCFERREEVPTFEESQSEVSCGTLPLPTTSFGRATSLEQRLAVEIFQAKLGQHRPSYARVHARRDDKSRRAVSLTTKASASSHEASASPAMRPLVPTEHASIDPLPSQLIGGDVDATSIGASSSTSVHEQMTSQSNDITPPRIGCLPPFLSESCRDAQSVERCGSMCEPCPSHKSNTSNKRHSRWKVEASMFFYDRAPVFDDAWRPAMIMVSFLFRALGLVPWSIHFPFRSRVYQFAVSCCLVSSTLCAILQAFSLRESIEGPVGFATHSDNILAVGALLSFSAALWNTQAWHDTSWLIDSYLLRANLLNEANTKSCLDIAIMFGLWVVCVGARFYSSAFELDINDFAFAFYMFILLAICQYALRVCRCLYYMVDHFCDSMQDNDDSKIALEEFFLLHCILRTACNSVQLCFVMLQLTGTVLFLVGSASIYFGAANIESILVLLIPAAVCELVIVHLTICGGLVSDLSTRVPMLVCSSSAKFKMELMYLLDYIAFCRSGFYIFEIRLNTATMLKLGYIAFVAWCSVLTQGLL